MKRKCFFETPIVLRPIRKNRLKRCSSDTSCWPCKKRRVELDFLLKESCRALADIRRIGMVEARSYPEHPEIASTLVAAQVAIYESMFERMAGAILTEGGPALAALQQFSREAGLVDCERVCIHRHAEAWEALGFRWHPLVNNTSHIFI